MTTIKTTIREQLKQSLLSELESLRLKNPKGYSFSFWKVKNDKGGYALERAVNFAENEIAKGYAINELEFKAKVFNSNSSYVEVSVDCINKISGYDDTYRFMQDRLTKGELTKSELEEIIFLENELVLKNRMLILNNPDEARKVEFYQNNLALMQVDQETHDYILSVIKADKEAEIKAKEIKKQEIRSWALANGSELLKARIEEGFNWFDLANTEYIKSQMPEGFTLLANYDKIWDLGNPNLSTIIKFKAAKENEKLLNTTLKKAQLFDEEDGTTTVYYLIVAEVEKFDKSGTVEVEYEISKETKE